MKRRSAKVAAGLILAFTVMMAAGPGRAAAEGVALLQVSKGQLPNDTASDGQTQLQIEELPALGGKALKVVYAAGDSFGVKGIGPKNWKPFVALAFRAFNPGTATVELVLTVKHRRTTSYQTRVDVPVPLKPGKNAVRIGIDEMLNVNGSTPDLSAVTHWYLACPDGAPTLYFGDFMLTGGRAAAGGNIGPGGRQVGGARPFAGKYRVTGTIGDQKVNLTIFPVGGEESAAGNPAADFSDPQRLARLRAAVMPEIKMPIRFNTPAADAVLTALEVFPPSHPFNQLIEDWPVHPASEAIIASIGEEKPLRCNTDMGFVIVPPNQPRIPVRVTDYPGESDPGPFPVPDELPIEGWPVHYQRNGGQGDISLRDVQADKAGRGGDRHAIIVDPFNHKLYEFFVTKRTATGWQAAQASVFNLKTGEPRPEGWTSADAAGLPIFPAVVRYDEIARGMVEHAMRVTVRKTRRAFVYPARHYASRHENEEYPRMGERLRLRQDVDISAFSPPVQAILRGLKRHGMFVADNGIEWAISVAPDPRIPELHAELRRLHGRDFEVVLPPGATP